MLAMDQLKSGCPVALVTGVRGKTAVISGVIAGEGYGSSWHQETREQF